MLPSNYHGIQTRMATIRRDDARYKKRFFVRSVAPWRQNSRVGQLQGAKKLSVSDDWTQTGIQNEAARLEAVDHVLLMITCGLLLARTIMAMCLLCSAWHPRIWECFSVHASIFCNAHENSAHFYSDLYRILINGYVIAALIDNLTVMVVMGFIQSFLIR